MEIGASTVPVVSECKDIVQGISQGSFKKVASKALVLGATQFSEASKLSGHTSTSNCAKAAFLGGERLLNKEGSGPGSQKGGEESLFNRLNEEYKKTYQQIQDQWAIEYSDFDRF